jgi:hypothetical protein
MKTLVTLYLLIPVWVGNGLPDLWGPIRGSVIIGSVLLEIRKLEVQSHYRFSSVIGSGIIGSVPLEVREL